MVGSVIDNPYREKAGTILSWSSATIPSGWLVCDGSAISRTTYKALFNAIGETYGAGDGATTFNLPDLQDKFVEGVGTNTLGTAKSAGVPNITGTFNGSTKANTGDITGAFKWTNTSCGAGFYNTQPQETVASFDASRCSAVYGNSSTVQPPAICINYIIKY